MIAAIKNSWLRRFLLLCWVVAWVVFEILWHIGGFVVAIWIVIMNEIRDHTVPEVKKTWREVRSAWRGPTA